MGNPFSALIVDGEAAIRRVLNGNLAQHGYLVIEAETGSEAMSAAMSLRPDVVLLDPALPDQDGLNIISRLKEFGALVLILSSRGKTEDKVRALDQGADDYLVKPFDVDELLARIRSGLRRGLPAQAQNASVWLGNVEVDLLARQVRKDGTEVHLTPKEFGFLAELLKYPGKVVSHSHLLNAVWGEGHETGLEYLHVTAHNIRRKLDDPWTASIIRSEPRIGYRLGIQLASRSS